MKLLRYFLVGGAAAAVDLGVFGALLHLSGGAWFGSAAASFVVATAVNYFLSITYVFRSGVRFGRRSEVALVFLVSVCGLVLNQSVMWLLIKVAVFNVWIAKILATASVFAWNFAARNFYVFRDK